MSSARDYRRDKDGRAVDRFAGRRRRCRPLLAALGLERPFGLMPRWAQEQFWAAKFPDPAVACDPGVPDKARRVVEHVIATSALSIPSAQGGRALIACRDFPTVLYAMHEMCLGTPIAEVHSGVGAFILLARPATRTSPIPCTGSTLPWCARRWRRQASCCRRSSIRSRSSTRGGISALLSSRIRAVISRSSALAS